MEAKEEKKYSIEKWDWNIAPIKVQRSQRRDWHHNNKSHQGARHPKHDKCLPTKILQTNFEVCYQNGTKQTLFTSGKESDWNWTCIQKITSTKQDTFKLLFYTHGEKTSIKETFLLIKSTKLSSFRVTCTPSPNPSNKFQHKSSDSTWLEDSLQ